MQVGSKFERRQIQGRVNSEARNNADSVLVPGKVQVSHQGKHD